MRAGREGKGKRLKLEQGRRLAKTGPVSASAASGGHLEYAVKERTQLK